MVANMELIEEFLESALAKWVLLFQPMVDGAGRPPPHSPYPDADPPPRGTGSWYTRLTDGVFLNEVMRLIDPNPKVEQLYHRDAGGRMLRLQNFSILNRHLRAFYQEDLQQLILIPLPNIAVLGQDPFTEAAVEELTRLLLLLLGCAVQCENKERFIQQIQSLDIQTQAAIASCIQEVTQDPRMVLPLQWEELRGLGETELELAFGSMAKQIQSLLAQRDTHLERLTELSREREELDPDPGGQSLGDPTAWPPQGAALQLADSRAKLRRLKQQLEDKGDQLLDYKQEVETMEEQLRKLHKENRALQGELRGVRSLRDELDCARERSGRVEPLQQELLSLRHKLRSLELTRTQLKEQQQQCGALQETQLLLEEQLKEARERCSTLRELRRDNLLLRQNVVELAADRDTERQRVDELLEINMSLEAELKHSSHARRHLLQSEGESDEEPFDAIDLKPLSVEVGEASTLMLLGAEQENAALRRRLEELQAQRESSVARDELAVLEEEHQTTLRQLWSTESENKELRSRLSSTLATGPQSDPAEEDREERREGRGEERREERGEDRSEERREERREERGQGMERRERREERREERGEDRSEERREDRSEERREERREERGQGLENRERREERREERMEVGGGKESGDGIGEEGKEGRGEERREERGAPGSEFSRGEGEGTPEAQEKEEEKREEREVGGVGSRREAGVGEERLLLLQGGEGEASGGEEGEPARDRGRAEGGQGRRGPEAGSKADRETDGGAGDKAQASTAPPRPAPRPRDEEGGGEAPPATAGPGMELLAARLREAREEADGQALLAQEVRSKLGEQSRRAWEAEQRLVLLEAELQRLRKAAEGLGEARRKIEVLQAEGLSLEEELCRLRSHQELHSMQSTVIAGLEGEKASLERERDALRSSMDGLRTAQRKGDQLQLTNQTLKVEQERLGRSLEASRRREAELEAELREATLEAEGLARGRDQALLEATRLEQEKEACVAALEGGQKEGRQREREAARLRQQLESTTLALEHAHQRARGLDAEHRRQAQELSHCRERCAGLQGSEEELAGRFHTLEEEQQRLGEQHADAQSSISALSQDLSDERDRSSGLTSEIEQLNHKLSRLEGELRTAGEALRRSGERTDAPPRLVEGSNLGVAPEGGLAGGLLVGGPSTGSSGPGEGLHDPESLSMAPGQDAALGRDPPLTPGVLDVETEKRQGRRSPELQREQAVLLAEREALLFRATRTQEACDRVREELEASRRHTLSLQDSCTKLQTLHTQLQVDHGTLSSQHASVLARCSDSEARCAALEAESKVWAREREESRARTDAMRRDQERMAALQQRQEAELEELLDKHSQLRTSCRSLEGAHRELEARYTELLDGRAQLEEREREMRMRGEQMDAEEHRRAEKERELERITEDYERLQAQQREWLAAQAELLAQGSVLSGELRAALLERTRLEGEVSTLRESNQNLDLCNVRLTSQYQLLTQLKGNMEEENRHLAEQSQSLLKENHSLLEQSLERRDQHHTQQREYQEKLGELRREKQKLVEKIMDQYRVLEPTGASPASKAKKSNWIADRMKKLIKPRAGGATREGRALFTTGGSVENLAHPAAYTHTLQADPLSAPVSPCPNRRAPLGETEISAPRSPVLLTGPMARRKLGSRHGWGLGLARAGSQGLSQSFSPGDLRLRTTSAPPAAASVSWEPRTPPRVPSVSRSQGGVEEEEGEEEKEGEEGGMGERENGAEE
uniref:Coiled-coil domain containing 88B n=1 Tax=Gadus morhua TaxID=8049 RepID=A0A8C5F9J6_GADMO